MKVQLTAAYAATAQCPPGTKKVTAWSDDLAGFVLEIRSSGSKTWAFRYVDHRGKQRQIKIARYGDITFSAARKVAERLRSETVLGNNPAARKEERKAVPIFAVLAARHAAHAQSYQKSWWSVEGILRRHLVPRFGRLRLDEIGGDDIAKFLGEKRAEGLKPATVEKIRVVLGRSFELARQWGIAGADVNPVRSVPRPRFSNSRERYLSAEEAARLLHVCDDSINPQLGSIVRLLLLTGARIGELLRAEWRHVNLERRAWLIPVTKTKPRYVPLSEAALGIISRLPRFEGCPYLVPNPKTRLPYVSIKHSFQTARKQAGLADVHIHDLRHSAASFMINAGIDLYAVGRVLGHADHQSTMRYSHLANHTLLAAVEAGAAKMQTGGFEPVQS